MITLDLQNSIGEEPSRPFNVSSIFDVGIDKKRKIYIPNANTPSQLGFECDRNLVFRRTRGQDAQKPNLRLQSVFELGKNIEDFVIATLKDGGAEIKETQRPLKDYGINLSGKIDCMLYHPQLAKKPMLCEIKSFSLFEFPKYNKQEDFLKSDKHYYRGYYTQLQAYLYLLSQDRQEFEESAILFLLNKNGTATKEIRFYRDDEHIEDYVLKKCERINNYVENKIIPDCEYNEELCRDCTFNHICDVGKTSDENFELVDDNELGAAIEEWERLKDTNKQYEVLDDFIKTSLKNYKKQTGKENFLLSNYEAKVNTCRRMVPTIPQEIKQQYMSPLVYDRVTIKKVTK